VLWGHTHTLHVCISALWRSRTCLALLTHRAQTSAPWHALKTRDTINKSNCAFSFVITLPTLFFTSHIYFSSPAIQQHCCQSIEGLDVHLQTRGGDRVQRVRGGFQALRALSFYHVRSTQNPSFLGALSLFAKVFSYSNGAPVCVRLTPILQSTRCSSVHPSCALEGLGFCPAYLLCAL